MKSVEKIVNGIYESTKIPFQLIIFDDKKYNTPSFEKSQDCLEKCFDIKFAKCCIVVNAAFSATIDLLKMILECKLEEIYFKKQNIIISLLNDKNIEGDIINNIFPNDLNDYYLVNIYVKSNIDGVCSYLKEGYANSDVEVFTFKNNIIIFGELEDVKEHIASIKETIEDNFRCSFYICYGVVRNISETLKVYNESVLNLDLAIKYKVSDNVFECNKLILEGIIDSINDEMKKSIYANFSPGFLQLDNEMGKTIDVFFKCGLNLSDAAKELYIHRNTLIYRLDKIEKYTGYDIKKFDNAVLFKIAFFLFKEKHRK